MRKAILAASAALLLLGAPAAAGPLHHHVVFGTDGPDRIDTRDLHGFVVVRAGAGADRIRTGDGGQTRVAAGTGNDRVRVGRSTVLVNGGDGRDVINAVAARRGSVVLGGIGRDRCIVPSHVDVTVAFCEVVVER